jgi:hypothetical protein
MRMVRNGEIEQAVLEEKAITVSVADGPGDAAPHDRRRDTDGPVGPYREQTVETLPDLGLCDDEIVRDCATETHCIRRLPHGTQRPCRART